MDSLPPPPPLTSSNIPQIPSVSSPGLFTNPFTGDPVSLRPSLDQFGTCGSWPKDSSDPHLQESQLDDKLVPPHVLNTGRQNRRHRINEASGSTDSSITFPPSVFSEVENFSQSGTPPSSVGSIPSITSTGAELQLSRSLSSGASVEIGGESYPQSPVPTDAVPFSGKVKLYAKLLDLLIAAWRLIIKLQLVQTRIGSGLC